MISKIATRTFSTAKKIYLPEQMKAVVAKTAGTVEKTAAITLGPYGRNVLIQNEMQEPRITKDGVTVVKHIEFENRMEDAIASLIKKSVDSTNKFAGDGTTTSTVLIGEIMKTAYRRIAAGQSVREIRKGLEIGRKIGIQFIESCSRKATTPEQLQQVAMISTNGKKDIAKLIAGTVSKASTVTVQKSQKNQNSVQFYSGMKLSRGIDSTEFCNIPGKAVFNYPLVLVSQLPLKSVKEIVKSLELAKKARKQLLIFAPDYSESVLSTLIYNNKKKIVQTACVSLPPYGDVGKGALAKLAKLTQSTLFSEYEQTKIEDVSWQNFGKVVKFEADQYEFKIEVQENQQNSNSSAVIFVGAPNQTALLENYDHIVDALNSVNSAKKDGIVAGGGVTLWRLADLLEQYQGEGQVGVKILAHAVRQPRKRLMQYVAPEKKPLSGQFWQGYDIKQQKIVDLFEAGIVDSVNVVKSTLIDSISLCCVLVEVDIGVARESKNLSTISLKDLNKKYSNL